MGVCMSCRRRERKGPEKRSGVGAGAGGLPGRAKGAAAELLPRRAAPDHLAVMANSISNIKMTNPIKGIVSKRKKRYMKDGFNLDLSYITVRLIAMGFPAEKLEGMYRNHIDEVYRFLELKHQDRYKIYNLCSERSYNSTKFHDRVAEYPFNDHAPPKIELIQPFCEDVHQWLSEHPENVAAVHCKAGKGRTGTMMCCYLLYSGQKATADEALNFYGAERTYDEKGVTIPSQRRYVEYYAELVRSGLQYRPGSLHIRQLVMSPPPALNGSQCPLELNIEPALQLLSGYVVKPSEKCITMTLNHCTPLSGDVKVEVSSKHKKKLFHFWFNTFFVAHEIGAVRIPPLADSPEVETFKLTLNKWQLDDAHKDYKNKLYRSDFKVELIVQKPPSSSSWCSRRAPDPVVPPSPVSSDRTDSDDDNDEHWDSGDKSLQPPDYWDSLQEKALLCPATDKTWCSKIHCDSPTQRYDVKKLWSPIPSHFNEKTLSESVQYPTHCEYGAFSIDTYSKGLLDTASISSDVTAITDISHPCTEKEGKIPKVSSDHTISSIDPVDRHLCEPRACKSPTEGGKKKYSFFQTGKKNDSLDCPEKRDEFLGNISKPRLSLGDMRASWREFSDKHFGSEHSKEKKKTNNGQTEHKDV